MRMASNGAENHFHIAIEVRVLLGICTYALCKGVCFLEPQSVHVVPVQILCIVEPIACLIFEGVACYVKRIRLAKCRQANERWTGNDGNNLK